MHKRAKIFDELDRIAPLIPIPIYWLDLNYIIVGGNDLCLTAIGSSAASMSEVLIGKTYYDYYPKEIADELTKMIKIVLEKNQAIKVEEKIVDITTGKFRYYETARAPLFDENNNVVGTICTAVEITDKKETETLRIENAKQVFENEKQKLFLEQQEKFRRIVDQVVHDIRSPVASMGMILPSCKKLPEAQRLSLTKAATRVMDVANRLLNEFQPTNHEISENQGNDNLPTLISSDLLEVISEKRFEYQAKTIDFCPHISQTGYFVFLNVDSSDFKRMLSNLINNAVDAIQNNKVGKIDLYLDVLAHQVQIAIQDNGNGMPDSIKEKILNNIAVTSGKTDGHGIGFSQIRDTLANSDGKLSIESTSGVGTRVILTFPKVDSPDWIAEKIELSNGDLIVILDDDESIHGAWETRFKKAAPDLIRKHFEQGEEAITFINSLEHISKEKVFLLTDFELLDQKLHGLNVVKQTGLKRSILVTSHHNSKDVRDLAKLNNTKILPKLLAPEIPITISKRQSQKASNLQAENAALKQVDIVLVDDDIEYANNFARFISANKKTIDKYSSTEELLDNVSQYPKETKLFIDNQLDKESLSGIDIAKQLHKMGFNRLYLLSGKDFSNDPSIPGYLNPILKTDIDYVIRLLNE